jgi:hypothetical protein
MSSHSQIATICMAAVCLISLALIACGSSVDGTYQDPTGMLTVELKRGKASARVPFSEEAQEGTYKVDGDKVTIEIDGDALEFTRNHDGSLSPPPGVPLGTLSKQN